jgi:hypothetical protein
MLEWRHGSVAVHGSKLGIRTPADSFLDERGLFLVGSIGRGRTLLKETVRSSDKQYQKMRLSCVLALFRLS